MTHSTASLSQVGQAQQSRTRQFPARGGGAACSLLLHPQGAALSGASIVGLVMHDVCKTTQNAFEQVNRQREARA